MLVLPGPGIVVVVLGFAILGTEYAWAATVLERTKRAAATAARGAARWCEIGWSADHPAPSSDALAL